MFLLLFRIIFYPLNVVKKVGCRHSVCRRSGLAIFGSKVTLLFFTSCDILLVAATLRMTELAAGIVYPATLCTRLVYYTERVTERVNFHALFIFAVTHSLHNDTMTQFSQAYHLRISKMKSCLGQ